MYNFGFNNHCNIYIYLAVQSVGYQWLKSAACLARLCQQGHHLSGSDLTLRLSLWQDQVSLKYVKFNTSYGLSGHHIVFAITYPVTSCKINTSYSININSQLNNSLQYTWIYK